MSYDLSVYTKKELEKDDLLKIQSRFKDFDMDIEFHPSSLNDEGGFFPIKMQVHNSGIPAYENAIFLTGFERYSSAFNFTEDGDAVENKEIENILQETLVQTTLSVSTTEASEFRAASFFALFLAELSQGIINNPQAGKYFTVAEALKTFPTEIKAYEESIPEAQFTVHPFEKWL